MRRESNWYLSSVVILCCFVAAQAFQVVASAYWIPDATSPQQSLPLYLLPMNELRATVVGLTILGLIIPYAVIALRYVRTEPLISLLGLVFGAGFVGAEVAQRSVDFFLVGAQWAKQSPGSSAATQAALLQRLELWNEITMAWYFPLLLAHLIASCCFLRVTWTDWSRGIWFRLAPIAFLLNALRLTGRILSLFAGQNWLDSFNNTLYFPLVLTVNILLIAWFVNLYHQTKRQL